MRYDLIVTLGAKSVLFGVVLTLSILGAFAFVPGLRHGRPTVCTRILPTVARDPDAQALVENLARAAPVIAQTGDAELYAASHSGGLSEFFFIRENQPRLFALLVYEDRPVPSNLTELRGLDFKKTTVPLHSLDDLSMGSIRAVAAVEAKYPAFSLSTLKLFRDEECRPVWRVGGTIDEEGKASLLLKAYVYSNGEIRLLDGPPLPYENILDIIGVNW